MVFDAGVVDLDLDLDDVGFDAIDGGAESFVEHSAALRSAGGTRGPGGRSVYLKIGPVEREVRDGGHG